MMNANIKSLADELKKSFFLRMKVPQDQIDAFVERIISLPEDKKRKALDTVRKAEQAFADLAKTEAHNSQVFLENMGEFRTKTKNKYQKKGKAISSSANLMADLKSKIKKQ